ncbi:hypothetical protein Mal4_57080 [Maioricimonas rarisocia]|uniref:Uncharacterized protein n=2 Tax=Maioricimonas rarisocia TaxID=2528026 RepID=A0A517ZFX4_9PLAN|nr:hypothetical protein Mal4_57080 [Maioricimonas rarisocia]
MPAIAMALLVVGMALAMVLDRLWIDAAEAELRSATEAAALAAAGQLAGDARLRADGDYSQLIVSARQAAGQVAASNRAAGDPVVVETASDRDIRFGHIVASSETGESTFLQTDQLPTTASVRALRTRGRGNPIARLFRELTGKPYGDARAYATASVDNRIIGLRPFDGGSIPAVPLGILETASDPRRTDTWQRQIDQREGPDDFAFRDGEVVRESDGIPEIILHTAQADQPLDAANTLLVDIGNGLFHHQLARQIRSGLDTTDLIDFGGEIRTDQGPYHLECDAQFADALDPLAGMIGRRRIAFLYVNPVASDSGSIGELMVSRLVAIRVLDIRSGDDGSFEIVVQPCVMTTRTALLANPGAPWDGSSDERNEANPYIFKLQLSR